MEMTNQIVLTENLREVIRITHDGMYYRGTFIRDAGLAHQLMVRFLRRATNQNWRD